MSVHLRKDGRWVVHFKDPENGTLKMKYFGRGLEGEAKAQAYNDSLGLRPWTRRTPIRKSPLFTDLVNAYQIAKESDLSEASFDNLAWKMEGVILPALGHMQALRITPYTLDLYVAKRLKTGIKKTTVHRELSDIRAVLNWSVKRQYITRNPILGYEMPKRDDAVSRPPSPEEVTLLLKHSPYHLKRSIYLAYYTGVRPGKELYSIRWSDVSWDEKYIMVISAKKGGLRVRHVPVHDDFYDVLLSWFESESSWKWFDPEKHKVAELSIINYRGATVKSVKKAFNTAKLNAGITWRLRLYDFRHAAITNMLAGGADLKATSTIAGHTRTDTTTRTYQHAATQLHRAAINKIPKLRDPGLDK
jgi:integrase